LDAQTDLGVWHLQGAEGLQKDAVRAAAFFRIAANLGHDVGQSCLGICYANGWGVGKNAVQAMEWYRKAADQGDAGAQCYVGTRHARGEGVKKDLPLGKRYLELSSAQGDAEANALLRELRKCVSCGELDVHHLICSQCRTVRYCDKECQVLHWQCPTDSHKLHCVQRHESAGVGGRPAERVKPLAQLELLTEQIAAAAAARVAGNDLFREQKYPEVWKPSIKQSTLW
jgi:hypothetical protein